jgi:uncharacterized lipoprotein YmbA
VDRHALRSFALASQKRAPHKAVRPELIVKLRSFDSNYTGKVLERGIASIRNPEIH